MPSEQRPNRRSAVDGPLDAVNRRLLAELQADARLSLAELGRRVGLSAPAVGERLQRLQTRITEQQVAFNRSSIGKETEILIERKGRFAGQMIGRSPWLQSVHVETDAVIGKIIPVTLLSAGPNSMKGAMLTKVAA